MKTTIAVLIILSGWANAENAWENYYNNSGEYFDRFFDQPRILYYQQNWLAHESTLRVMARYGVRYRDWYTGEWNLPQ